MPRPDAGLGLGIITGDNSGLDKRLGAAMRSAVPTHLSAVSGGTG